jgi:glycerol-3-phosphate dehydrogenase (NAD(P)+)
MTERKSIDLGDREAHVHQVAVIGAGSWGTAVAGLVARNADVTLWALESEIVSSVNERRMNDLFHPGVELPERVRATGDLAAAADGAQVIVLGVPTQFLRGVLRQVAGSIARQTPVVSLAKGIEVGSLMRPTEIISEVMADHDPTYVGVLAGPNLAKEVMTGKAAAAVVAFSEHEVAERLQPVFTSATFRVYTNDDVVGCELGGALKNVIAVAAGMARGLGHGQNFTGALLSRGLTEMCRIGLALGARAETFLGLSGQGDLVATCLSSDSRNHHLGYELARGRTLADITAETNMVAEGAKSVGGVVELAQRLGVRAPIAEMVRAVVVDGVTPAEAFEYMTAEPATHELSGILDARRVDAVT